MMLEPTANNIAAYRDELTQLSAQAFDSISEIQRGLLFPKAGNLAEIKKRYGIPMSARELSVDLKHPYSRVRRSLNAVISECFMLREIIADQINRIARIATLKRKLSRLEAAMSTSADRPRVDEYQQRIDAIMDEIEKMHQELDYHDFKISLENFDVYRQQELNAFENMFGEDTQLHKKVAPLFKQRLDKAQGYLQQFNDKINDPKTSLEEKKRLQKQEKKFIKHLQDAKVENMLKRVPQYKDLATGEETAAAVIGQGMVTDELMGVSGFGIQTRKTKRRDSENNKLDIDIMNAGGLNKARELFQDDSTVQVDSYYTNEFKTQVAWPYANLLDSIQNGLEKLSESEFSSMQQNPTGLQRLLELSDDCYDLKASQDAAMIPLIQQKVDAIVRDVGNNAVLQPIVEAVKTWQQQNSGVTAVPAELSEQLGKLRTLLEESRQENDEINGPDLKKLQDCIQSINQLDSKPDLDSADRLNVEELKADIVVLAASYGDDDERLMTAMRVSESIKFAPEPQQPENESEPSDKPSAPSP